MYKAYLEAIGVASLGNILILKDKLYKNEKQNINLNNIYDIDSNVVIYGLGKNYLRIQQRFNSKNKIKSSNVVPDILGTKEQQLKYLVSSFINSGKELLFLDITNTEARELNFYVSRLWSKDTLSLCFPSAAPTKHPRFIAYGGFVHDEPHPYP